MNEKFRISANPVNQHSIFLSTAFLDLLSKAIYWISKF